MVKMLIFDLKDSEKDFFKNDFYTDFDITFFKESLNIIQDVKKQLALFEIAEADVKNEFVKV